MENPPKRMRISRIDLRYRHQAEDISPKEEVEKERATELREEEQQPLFEDVDEPLLIREKKGRFVMGRAHRDFHRRQAEESQNVLTVVVDVIATVDGNGNVIGKETVTPSVTPAAQSVQIADVVPTVPSVPAFPSDLTVPAVPPVPTDPLPSVPSYPFASGVSTVQSAGSSSQLVISSPVPTSELTSGASSSGVPTALPSSSGFNFTISSSILSSSSSPTLSSSLNTTSTSSASSSRSSTSSSISSTLSSTSQASTTLSSPTSSASDLGGGGGGGDPANTASPPAATTTTAAGNGSDSGNDNSISTPKVVGSVIGSLAGAALLLVLLLFLINRHKRKQRAGTLPLPGNDGADSQPIAASGQQMATRSSYVPAGAATFFSRFSGASRSTAETSTTGERGFQRISGRKLPSAFSEGMTSEQFTRGEGTLSGSSFYKDDSGFYGGPAAAAGNKEFSKETGEPSSSGAMGTKERIMPSPARTPVIHHPDDAPPFGTSRNGGGNPFSPPHNPNPDVPARGTLGRSHPSHDGSRGSRFTEDV